MADWISQLQKPSVTERARQRTAYLGAVRDDVEQYVQGYLGAHPSGTEVTPHVLQQLGATRLQAIAPGRSLDRLKQDVGLLTVQVLVDLHGAARVETLRNARTLGSSTRRCRSLDWVSRYTPHRVLSAPVASGRLVISASVVRDAEAVRRLLPLAGGGAKLSLSEGALGVLLALAYQGETSWRVRAGQLDMLLDPQLPLVPAGPAAVVLWPGAAAMAAADARALQRARWAALCAAASVADLQSLPPVSLPSGRVAPLGLGAVPTRSPWAAWRDAMPPGLVAAERAAALRAGMRLLAPAAQVAAAEPVIAGMAQWDGAPVEVGVLWALPMPARVVSLSVGLSRLSDAILAPEAVIGAYSARS